MTIRTITHPPGTGLIITGATKPRKSPGPAPDVLKIEGNWKDAVGKALQVKKPSSGWPKMKPRRPKKST
jgi:hypothetical protein